MLELPEVEVLRKDLEKEVVGKKVKSVEVETASIVRPLHRNRPDFVKALEGRKIETCRRRGATILLDLDEDQTWVVRPGSTGSVHRETANEPTGPDTHLVVTFTTGGALHLSDASSDVDAQVGIVATDEVFDAIEMNPDALDPLEDSPTWMEFAQLLRAAGQPLKLWLTDPDHVVGIGPVYSDEILWESGLRYDRVSDTLSIQEIRRFYRAIHEVIQAAMKQRGSNLDEAEAEVAVDEEGEVAEHLKVYGREGQPCFRCRKDIVRVKVKKGVESFFCEQCMV